MAEVEGTFADGRLFYRAWEVDEPRAQVVVAHGFAEHSGRYGHVARRLNADGVSVWAPDHRGHGRSEGERANIESVAAAVGDLDLFVNLVAERAPSGPLVLVGHSMGGLIATAYAQAHQARLAALALSAPLVFAPPELLALADLDEIPDLGLADAVSSDPEVVRAYQQDPLVYQGPPPRGFLRAVGELIGVRERFAAITLPVLVMQGSDDGLVSPQALRDVVVGVSSTDLTARLWPGMWHEIFHEPGQAAVLDLLATWILSQVRA